MLRRVLLLLILVSAVSCAPGIYAKTDCDRWLAQYKQALLQKRAVQRAAAAKRRMQQKLVGAVTPGPAKPVTRRPVLKRRMSPLEALNHFQLACGELEPTPLEGPGLLPAAFNGLPAFDLPEFPYTPTESSPIIATVVPPETLPPVVDTPVTTPTPPGPIIGGPPVVVTPPSSPVAPVVPEPSSIVLVMTGIGAAVAAGRRRLGR